MFPKLKALNSIVCLIVLGTVAFIADSALAGKVKLSNKYSAPQLQAVCERAGGTFDGSGPGHGCYGPKGHVTCDKNGNCVGHCEACGQAKSAPMTRKGAIRRLLTNTLVFEQAGESQKVKRRAAQQ